MDDLVESACGKILVFENDEIVWRYPTPEEVEHMRIELEIAAAFEERYARDEKLYRMS